MAYYNQAHGDGKQTSDGKDAHAFDYHQPSEDGKPTPAAGAKEMELTDTRVHPAVGYGHAPPAPASEYNFSNSSSSETQDGFLSAAKKTKLVQGLYIGIFAIFGSFIRILTAQLFGEECNNPGTVGWLASGSPLCVTGSRKATEEGGIIFADLPANMLGSFVMGILASCATLRLAVSTTKLAWLRPDHPFQKMPILHKAITTGFCGSLTTFSGWNSSMVILLFGTGYNRSTHVINALFGYIIGMEVSMGCYVAGKSLARRIYRIVNPIFARESDAMYDRQKEGVFLNPDLPNFERRFLPNLNMGKLNGEKDYGEVIDSYSLEYLTQWRASTESVRRVNHPMLPTLNTIERAILIDNTAVPLEAESIAQAQGWDTAALREWTRSRGGDVARLPSISDRRHSLIPLSLTEPETLFSVSFAGGIFLFLMGMLLAALFWIQGESTYAITDRTMVYAMMFAPLGALIRWELSPLNGTLSWGDWTWFPIGTFTANLVGSIMSIATIAMEYIMTQPEDYGFWGVGTIRAIKVGFIGSLTTVSTFVAEVDGFITNHTDHAYPYMFVTLGCCCAVSSAVYAIMVFPKYN